MTFDWNEYFKVAEKIESTGQAEVWQRIAASRAYYAIFHLCKGYAYRNGKTPATGRINAEHADIPAWLRRPSASVVEQEAGGKLQRLRLLRNNCDYEDNVRNLGSRLSLAVIEIRDIKQTLGL